MMTTRRWPALLVIPALIAAMVAIDQSSDDETGTGTSLEPIVVPPDPMPVAASDDASLSTFYCASATGSGNRDIHRSVLVVSNTSEEARTGTVTAYPEDGDEVEVPIDLAAGSRWSLDPAEITDASRLGLLVEVDGGEVAASMVVSSDEGSDVAACSSSAGPDWYIPAASTTLDARAVLTLFNPFPDDAVVRVEFATGDEIRVPQGFEGVPVPARSVVALDVTDVVTVRTDFATAVEARSGKVIAELLQKFDGSEGRDGLALTLGAPAPQEVWFFPAADTGDDLAQTFAIYNPTDTDAIVDLGIAVEDPETNGAVLPIEVEIPRRSTAVVRSSDEVWSRVPPGVPHSASVRSRNDVPVVAQQLLSYTGDRPGLRSTLGSPLVAEEWIVPTGDIGAARTRLVVLNPSATEAVKVSVAIQSQGAQETVDFEVDPAERRVLAVEDLSSFERSMSLLTAADGFVVVELVAGGDEGQAAVMGSPVSGSSEVPDPLGE